MLGWILVFSAAARVAAAGEQPILLREALVIPSVGGSGRVPFRPDAVHAKIAAGTWTAPVAGASVLLPDGEKRVWTAAVAGEDGWLTHEALLGGYAFFSIDADTPGVMTLEARAHGMVYVNGEPRYGDRYDTGNVRIPVALRRGENEFLFHGVRGRLWAQLVNPQQPLQFNALDATLPDIVVGEGGRFLGAICQGAIRCGDLRLSRQRLDRCRAGHSVRCQFRPGSQRRAVWKRDDERRMVAVVERKSRTSCRR